MMEQVLDSENLHAAWRRVTTNAGAPGIDGMTVDAFPAFARKHWPRIRSALASGTYRPAAVRRVFIPKPDGTQRPLGVPTVLDRVIQQALAQVLTPLFECEFSNHSHGFREGRNAHQAVREVEACWKEGRRHLLALGTPPDEVKLATRSRKGLPFPLVTADPVGRPLASPVWRMSGNRIVQQALTNRWLHEQGVPDMRTSWIALHYGPIARI